MHRDTHRDPWFGERIILLRSRAEPGTFDPGTPKPGTRNPGTILAARGESLIVATGRGAIALTEVQREGKRPTGVREFMAGRGVQPGDCFVPPP